MIDFIAFLTISALPLLLFLLLLTIVGFIGTVVITIALNTSYDIVN